jgi:hypothetical protein
MLSEPGVLGAACSLQNLNSNLLDFVQRDLVVRTIVELRAADSRARPHALSQGDTLVRFNPNLLELMPASRFQSEPCEP